MCEIVQKIILKQKKFLLKLRNTIQMGNIYISLIINLNLNIIIKVRQYKF